MGERFNDCLALLDVLGWEAEDERESFELTGPAQQIARVLPQLQHRAAGSLTTDILEHQFNQRGMERTALASAVFSRLAREVEAAAAEPTAEAQAPESSAGSGSRSSGA
ncbi:MAG: hypothetical protein Q8O56_03965 [Solirubrobacteraceae bacterium]|nr:hypothetical protein [Solirubrobacteraceae bacterium]